ncbi:MAG: acyl carrier protein [Planctomycetes bacterium]|nr:acyl carrier protein [Planctomycetota bacterium]
MPMSKDEIFDKVRATLVDALSVDDDDVRADATVMGDLGAESIDFLDIVFRLEKTFGIKIPQEELMPRDILQNPDYVVDKKLNAAGLAALKKAMPHADLTNFEKSPEIDRLAEVFTVGAIVKFIEAKLASK